MAETLTFGGANLTQWLKGIKVSRAVAPKTTVDETEVPGLDGTAFRGSSLQALDVTVTGALRGHTVEEVTAARHSLAAALAGEAERELYLPDDPSLFLLATCTETGDLGRSYASPPVEIRFHASKPYSYGAQRTQAVAGSASVAAGGNAPAWPTITATPSSDTFAITYGGKTLSFSGVSGKALSIDCENDFATAAGVAVCPSLASDYFALQGTKTMTVSGGTATVRWRPTWV